MEHKDLDFKSVSSYLNFDSQPAYSQLLSRFHSPRSFAKPTWGWAWGRAQTQAPTRSALVPGILRGRGGEGGGDWGGKVGRRPGLGPVRIRYRPIVFALGGSPTPHPISSRPHFVCKFSYHGSSSPVTSHLAPSITLMHIVAQLRPIDLLNFLGQIPESSQFLGTSKLPLLE
jgi:hypothetical protein